MQAKYAIKVDQISKHFKLPRVKIDSVRGMLFGLFRRREYDNLQALDKVSFEVAQGEFFGIIGRNGSGKSTLLKILAGVYSPDRGKVKKRGRLSPFLELGIGFNPELTAKENVYLSGIVLGLSRQEIDRKFPDIIAFAELEKFVNTKVKNFSSGMYVRLAFAVAIQIDADILLIDEVLAVGDANFQAKCFDVFKDYKMRGKTVILVSHDLETVKKYCDRAIFLESGKICSEGNSRKVVEDYLYSNMTKEEIWLREKDKKIIGTKAVTIEKIVLTGSKSKGTLSLQSLEDIKIAIHYRNNRKVKNAAFGIEIFDSESNECLFGVHTGMLKRKVSLEKDRGFVSFVLKNIPFKDGDYYLNPAIANTDCTEQYDYWQKAEEFSVTSEGILKELIGKAVINTEFHAK